MFSRENQPATSQRHPVSPHMTSGYPETADEKRGVGFLDARTKP